MPAPLDTPALFTDLYQLTMMQAYFEEPLAEEATFSLYIRRLPPARNFLIACGLETVLEHIERLRFQEADIDYLASLRRFSEEFLDWLLRFRFTGEIRALAEGTPFFANEPILEITAPIAQAQFLETFVLNQVHLQTLLASKAMRVVLAAGSRPIVDFGARRIHGTDAALKAARAFHIAGVSATSNVLAGKAYRIPLTGTMAHSYVQAHDREIDAFRAFARTFPETTLLVDTYDSLEGVGHVIDLARELGPRFAVKAVRLDSGDLAELAREARRLLDAAGLGEIAIIASGGLGEIEIAGLVASGAPIDLYGVGTQMGVSRDSPDLDIAYKLVAYAGKGRLKLSPGKVILPGRKQIYRTERNQEYVGDIVSRFEEELEGRALLRTVMLDGRQVSASPRLEDIRDLTKTLVAKLPARLKSLSPAEPPYRVQYSDALKAHAEEVTRAALARR